MSQVERVLLAIDGSLIEWGEGFNFAGDCGFEQLVLDSWFDGDDPIFHIRNAVVPSVGPDNHVLRKTGRRIKL